MQSGDQAWLVVDKDHWRDEQLLELHAWTKENDAYHLALSNPCFELWLLLHFEDGVGGTSASDLRRKLRQHLPDYNKDIGPRQISRTQIDAAIDRARQLDQPPCGDWPRTAGRTTVYRLVENILQP